jgi:hypothetical protein
MAVSADPAGNEGEQPGEEGLRCDFCGAVVHRVRRIALDGDYDRLQPHRVKYACPDCSAAKERSRDSEPG